MTGDYLYSPWCFTHTQSGDGTTEENRNFLFRDDGTFSVQQSSHNSKMSDRFTYEIMAEKLKLTPIYPGTLGVKSAGKEELVLN